MFGANGTRRAVKPLRSRHDGGRRRQPDQRHTTATTTTTSRLTRAFGEGDSIVVQVNDHCTHTHTHTAQKKVTMFPELSGGFFYSILVPLFVFFFFSFEQMSKSQLKLKYT